MTKTKTAPAISAERQKEIAEILRKSRTPMAPWQVEQAIVKRELRRFKIPAEVAPLILELFDRLSGLHKRFSELVAAEVFEVTGETSVNPRTGRTQYTATFKG